MVIDGYTLSYAKKKKSWKLPISRWFPSYVKITRGYSGGNHDIIGYDIVDYNNSR